MDTFINLMEDLHLLQIHCKSHSHGFMTATAMLHDLQAQFKGIFHFFMQGIQ